MKDAKTIAKLNEFYKGTVLEGTWDNSVLDYLMPVFTSEEKVTTLVAEMVENPHEVQPETIYEYDSEKPLEASDHIAQVNIVMKYVQPIMEAIPTGLSWKKDDSITLPEDLANKAKETLQNLLTYEIQSAIFRSLIKKVFSKTQFKIRRSMTTIFKPEPNTPFYKVVSNYFSQLWMYLDNEIYQKTMRSRPIKTIVACSEICSMLSLAYGGVTISEKNPDLLLLQEPTLDRAFYLIKVPEAVVPKDKFYIILGNSIDSDATPEVSLHMGKAIVNDKSFDALEMYVNNLDNSVIEVSVE